MYPAVIKRQLLRPSAVQITKVTASIHGKAVPRDMANEEFFINTTFPDDFQGMDLKPEDLMKKEDPSKKQFSKAEVEQHMSDIYESLYPREVKKSAKVKPPKDMDPDVPDMHEL